jgi:sterol desaturase/sphingolipid hydroxylase (fatty acid hydroxylase superfamily)
MIYDLGYYSLVFLAFILGRYLLLAGGTYWVMKVISRRRERDRSAMQSRQRRLIHHDIWLSVYSAFWFALVAAIVMVTYQAGYTRIYTTIEDYGWWYLGTSFLTVLLLQDAYFYLAHRLLHLPFLFQHIHRGHHRSRRPTPWTSFAFEPSEALIHSVFFVGLVMVLPLHYLTLIAAFLTMTIWAIATHLGFPLMPSDSPLRWLGRGFIGPAHHGIHHRQYQVHFGLYFTFWDHLLGTTDPSYLQPTSPPNKL